VNNAVKVLLAVAAFAGAFVGSQALYKMSRPRTSQEIQADVDRDVANLKSTLPQDVHPMVTWFDVASGSETIIYKYKVKVPRSALMARRKEMEKELEHGFAGWAVAVMLPRDVHAQAEFYDQNGSYAFTVDIK
jgi:hypothetical protein